MGDIFAKKRSLPENVSNNQKAIFLKRKYAPLLFIVKIF